jgi:polysaccharide pyruvyl transferase WcaK-like protein
VKRSLEHIDGVVAITVRDVATRRLLEQIGAAQDITVTADPALLLEPLCRWPTARLSARASRATAS